MGLYVGADNEAVPMGILSSLETVGKSDRLRGVVSIEESITSTWFDSPLSILRPSSFLMYSSSEKLFWWNWG